MIRKAEGDADSESSDDDFGPMPVQAESEKVSGETDGNALSADNPDLPVEYKRRKKKAKKIEFEDVYIENLPVSDNYEHSYMHRDVITHIGVSKATEFIITASADGHIKFWKKMVDSIEFVKHYQAHLGAIRGFSISADQKMLVTTGADQMIKFFEILGFDMSNMISVPFYPNAATWLSSSRSISDKVAISDLNTGIIRIYKAEGSQEAIQEIKIHSSPVKCMALNTVNNCVISVDNRGIIEYWDSSTNNLPTSDKISFQLKTDTDLYDLAKTKTIPCNIAISPSGTYFATFSQDKQVRVFDFKTGKKKRQYDESVKAYQSNSRTLGGMDDLELGRRQAVERELEASIEVLSWVNLVFDESSNFLIFSSLRGIKIVNIVTNKLVRVIGGEESTERFITVALYQGVPKVDNQFLLSRANAAATAAGASGGASANSKTVEQQNLSKLVADPTIYCSSFKKRRFYCFSNREPDESNEARDKFNEMPTEEEKNAAGNETHVVSLSQKAVLHTTVGDIFLKLYPGECPKTVENFTTHIKNGYYNGLIFHRVIKGFMIQTGDPQGDGTGGESIWGGEFEDELVRTLKHDRPYTLSMANAGPNTNGSQFFITTVPTPWLDNKHTVFGRVTTGYEVVSAIENVKVNKLDKPYDDIKILSAEVL